VINIGKWWTGQSSGYTNGRMKKRSKEDKAEEAMGEG
jgi:hypothetical protein